jgi:hypothetical protein
MSRKGWGRALSIGVRVRSRESIPKVPAESHLVQIGFPFEMGGK